MTHDSISIETPIGWITLTANEEAILSIRWGKKQGKAQSNSVLKLAIKELSEYFLGKRKTFSVPFLVTGTSFQQAVWRALEEIPYGECISYGELARKIRNPKATRAVGTALGKNPIPILLPCHRVIAAREKLGGFTGSLRIKQGLLKLEGNQAFALS